MVVCMFSKCYATRHFLHNSWIQLVVDFEPTHDLHTNFGLAVLVFSLLHGITHAARYIVEDSASLLYTMPVNQTGALATLFLLILAVPMAFQRCRAKVSEE
ncbi:unnamed protein product [Sphacelaria rigidula]